MQVTTIYYERKRSDGHYGNRAVALSASVDVHDTLADCVRHLRSTANDLLDEEERLEQEEREREQVRLREQYERRKAECMLPGEEQEEDHDAADWQF